MFPIHAGSLSALLTEAFREGWANGQKLPEVPAPPMTFDLMVNRETEHVEAFARLL